ncbi:TonB-dependent receptor plug domain-containing protein [Hyphococcus sp.]|uniref:TonB-dependent receptor plug domain-containing protein n=1 Tax=Hyphococcus sp. TaxID=2038636 RepID=UPI0020803AFC|nr:MAG: ligand-gated channel [Marinicaulis sp.]
MTTYSTPAFCLLISTALCGQSFAADNLPLTDEIVVSATLTPTPLSETGSSVTIITAEEIQAQQYSFLVDVLRDSPGVSVARNGGFGGAASARLRGASSGQTLVVVDGVTINDPSAPQGGFNFANFDVADIDRVEVLRGPQSLIYGADAIGGVISVTTARNASSSAYIEGGSRGTVRGGATASISNDTSFARATVSGARTDGISRADGRPEKDGYRTISGSFSGGVDLNEHWSAQLIARVSDSHVELDGFPPPLFSLADTDGTEDTREYLIAGKFLQNWAGLDGALTVSYNAIDREDFEGGFSTFVAKGDRLTANYVAAVEFSKRARVIGGVEVERTSAIVSSVDEAADAGAAFALVEVKPFDSLTLSAGGRRDEFSNFEGETTARASAVWAASDKLLLRASWGEGFRAPSLFELNFDQFGTIPNPDLRPEHANGFDIGVETRFGAASEHELSVTLFHTRVTDQIDFDFAGSGYFNIDETRARGVEIDAHFALSDQWSARTVYSFADAVDKATGAQLLRQPRHKGNATVSFAPNDALTVSASAIFNGRENDTPATNASYVRLDLRAAYTVSDHLELYGRIENATDANYQDVSGYGEAGVSAFAGVRLRR